ncbi:MAG TPA: OmpA family protein, partial [Bacteroidia bacterium]|nr:OmpA family protein [Bacteroidia bacterium]
YQEALPIYMRLLKLFPENDNLKYRIGICLLNDPYQKEESISYLEQAIKNCAKDYKENSFKETRAPLDAWFYLGKAYLVNNRINEAIEAYSHFRKILDPKVYDANLVDEQIEACKNAIKLMKKPIDLDFINLGEPINSRFAETNPVVTHDETSMLFIRKLQFYDAVFYSRKVNGQWTEPENIMFDLGVDGDMYPCSLSADGTEAFFYSNDNYLGTIFTSKLVNGKWTKVRALNSNINTKYWESHACISADGTTLYFTSNRKGGFGGLDIYKSVRTPNGDWGPPVNLGPTVNTRYNEDTPFITEDGKTLYFSSKGHNTIGGYDVFVSVLKNGDWSQPINLGMPLNTPGDDVFFQVSADGKTGYFSSYRKEGLGDKDVYKVSFLNSDSVITNLVLLKGIISDASTGSPISAQIEVVDLDTNLTVGKYKNDAKTGEYLISLPAGKNYGTVITADGYLFESQNYDLNDSAVYKEVKRDVKLQSVKKGSEITLNNLFFDSGSTGLKETSVNELNRLLRLMQTYPQLKVEIAGHCDNVGGAAFNQDLSEKRARAVKDFLVKHAIQSERLTSNGYGYTKPLADNDTEEGRAKNRRIELIIISE